MRRTLCITILLAATAAANGAFPAPPPPDWFQIPPGGTTRLQHHSFHADPNLNQQPEDWTIDGFVPSQPDSWAMPPGVIPQNYNQPADMPWAAYWASGGAGVPLAGGFLNDNIGLVLTQGGTLTKTMGNRADENEIKEFYALAIWSLMRGQGVPQLTISVSSPGAIVNTTTAETGEAGTFATVIEGTIEPQPDFEDFSFTFSGPALLDEIYIGTHCTPEPATVSLLALGGLAVLRRRRKR